MTAKLRVMPAWPEPRFAIEVLEPREDTFRPYVHGTSAEIDAVLRDLEPADGELVYDCRQAA